MRPGCAPRAAGRAASRPARRRAPAPRVERPRDVARSRRHGRSRPSGSRSGIIGQRQKSSTEPPCCVGGLDPQRDQPGRGRARPAAILLQAHDLGAACAACRRRTPAARARARGRRGCRARAATAPVDCPIATSQTRLGCASGAALPVTSRAQRRVEREPQPVARSIAWCSAAAPAVSVSARCVVEHLAALEVLEPRPSHAHGRRLEPAHRGAPSSPAARPRATTCSASLRLASSIISPSSSTAPRPSAAGRARRGSRAHARAPRPRG